MARSTGSSRDDDFERQWEALTEQLGDLKPADEFEDDAGDDSAGRRDADRGTGPAAGRGAGKGIGRGIGRGTDRGAAGHREPSAPDEDWPVDEDWQVDAPFDMGGPRDYEPADDEGFVPPTPEPISTRRPWLVVGWIGLAASALVLLVCGVLRTVIPVVVPQIAGGALLVSLAVLFTQLPKGRSDDDPDKGAVV